MTLEQEVAKANKLLGAELGLNPYGEPRYKWLETTDISHHMYRDDQWVRSKDSHLYINQPEYKKLEFFAQMFGKRWLLGIWMFTPEPEWRQMFGNKIVWSSRGNYWPTNLIMLEGKRPTISITEEIIQRYRRQQEVIASGELDQRFEAEEERKDRALYNTIHDIIDDSLTAFGNDPGKRSGGVSLPQ
jgi:hypothetical protein